MPARPHERPGSGKTSVLKTNIDDGGIEALRNFADQGQTFLLLDTNTGKRGERDAVPGLRCRIGRRSTTWLVYTDEGSGKSKANGGTREITSTTIGHWPDMDVATARDRARSHARQDHGQRRRQQDHVWRSTRRIFGLSLDRHGRGTGDRNEPGITDKERERRKKLREKRKPARWYHNVKLFGKKYLIPEFGKRQLADMSTDRKKVGEWYNKLAREHVSTADHCRKIIRAVFNRQIDKGENLTGHNPARAKIDRQENWAEDRDSLPVLAFDQFPAWTDAWRKLPPLNRAYQLTAILTGARPGELSRTKWTNLNREHRTLTINDSKAGYDIVIPVSEAIFRALDMAREFAPDGDVIFPGSAHWGHRDPLPARGHALRRAFKTVANNLGRHGISDKIPRTSWGTRRRESRLHTRASNSLCAPKCCKVCKRK